jgi:hypothetical protein
MDALNFAQKRDAHASYADAFLAVNLSERD